MPEPEPASFGQSLSHSPTSNASGGPQPGPSGASSHSPSGAFASGTQPPHSIASSTGVTANRPLNANDIHFQVIGKQPSLLSRLSDSKAMSAPYRSPSPIPPQSPGGTMQPPLSRPSLFQSLSKPSPSAGGSVETMRLPERMETPLLRYPESEGRPSSALSAAPDAGTGEPNAAHSIPATSADAGIPSKAAGERLSPKKESGIPEQWHSQLAAPNNDSAPPAPAPARTSPMTTESDQNAPSSSQLYDLLETSLQQIRSNWETSPLPASTAPCRQDTPAQGHANSPRPANDPAPPGAGTMVLHQPHSQSNHHPSSDHTSPDHAVVLAPPPSQSLAASRAFEEHTAVFLQLAEAMHRDAQANTRSQAEAEREFAERWQSVESYHRFLDDKQRALEENERHAREELDRREMELRRKEEETMILQQQLRSAEASHRQIESELRAKGQELAELEGTWRQKMRELDDTRVYIQEVRAAAEAKAREEAKAKEEAKAREEVYQNKNGDARFTHLKPVIQSEDGMSNEELEAVRGRNDIFREADAMRTGREDKLQLVERYEETLRQLKEKRLRAIAEARRRAAEDEKRRAEEQAKRVAEEARLVEEEGRRRAANEEVLRQMSNVHSPRVVQSSATAHPTLQFNGHNHNFPRASPRSSTSELLAQQARVEVQARAPPAPSELERHQQRLRAELEAHRASTAKASPPVTSLAKHAQNGLPSTPLANTESASASSTKSASTSAHLNGATSSKSIPAAATNPSKPLSGNVKVAKAPSTNPQALSSSALPPRPKSSTLKGFVPASTDAGRRVCTDMPFSSVSFPPEDSVGTVPQTSPAISRPKTPVSQAQVLDDMSGGQHLELGPPGTVSPAQQRANLRHLKRAHSRSELSAGGDRSVRSGPADTSAPSVKQEESQNMLAPPVAPPASSLVINKSQQAKTPAFQEAPIKREPSPPLPLTVPQRTIIPPPRPKVPLKKTPEQPPAPVTSGPPDLQQPQPAKTHSPLADVHSHASSNPWNMDASNEPQEWAPARTPPPTNDRSRSPVGNQSQQQAASINDASLRSEAGGSRSSTQAEHVVPVNPRLPARPRVESTTRRGYDHYSPPPVSPPQYRRPSGDRYVPSDASEPSGGQSRKRPREDEGVMDDLNSSIRRRPDLYRPADAGSGPDGTLDNWWPRGYDAGDHPNSRSRSPVNNFRKRSPPPPVRSRNIIYEREPGHSPEAPIPDRQQRAAARGRAKKGGVQGRKMSPQDTLHNVSQEQLREDNPVTFPQPQQEPIALLERMGDRKEGSQQGRQDSRNNYNRNRLPLFDRLSTSVPKANVSKSLEERLG